MHRRERTHRTLLKTLLHSNSPGNVRDLRLRSESVGTNAVGASAVGTLTIGSVAIGALALGALAIGALAIGRLMIGRARIRRLEIDELVVRRLRITGDMQVPDGHPLLRRDSNSNDTTELL